MTTVAEPAPARPARYGGHRLDPAYYEPARVPAEVSRLAGVPDTLPTGSPGKVGLLELEFACTAHGTELVGHYQKSPLQIMRPLYYDPARPDMPYTYLMSTGPGIVQGDRLRTDLVFGAGTSAHVTTSAYTKVLRMEHDYAVSQTSIAAGPDSYVEYLPDPVIAFAGARLFQRTRVSLDPTATLVVGETRIAGRLARAERHEYAVLASDLEVTRPDGTPLALDRLRLVPADGAAASRAVLAGHDVVSTLCVLTDRVPAAELAEALHRTLHDREDGDPPLVVGVSTLPGENGAWVRILGDDTLAVTRAMTRGWRAVRLLLTGLPAPALRKS